MADAASTPKPTVTKTNDDYVSATYGTMTGVATGAKFSLGRIQPGSMSVQMIGTFGSGTFVLAGSNDGTNWKTCYLERQQTTAGKQDVASFTSDDTAKVMDDAYRYYRVTSSGGTGTTVTATIVARRA